MSPALRHVAPAGAPVGFGDIARAVAMACSQEDVVEGLSRAIRERFAVRHCVSTATGRAGLTLLLKALRRIRPGDRDEVIVPSYTCYSVAASVVKAGLNVRLVDLAPATLDFAPPSLSNADFRRVLAIVATNLYGLPNDHAALEAVARAHGAFVIDDAAQAMGASYRSRPSGTLGDAGIYSFDKGKNVSAVEGGAVVTDSREIADAVTAEMRAAAGARSSTVASAVNAIGYAALLHPIAYGVPARIPQLGLGRTIFSTAFDLGGPDRFRAALAATMLGRLDQFGRARAANAARLVEGLRTLAGVRLVSVAAGAVAAHPRLPVLIEDEAVREQAIRSLVASGIGATASYPAALADVPGLAGRIVPGSTSEAGRYVAARILTLPIHPFVRERDIDRALETLAACLGRTEMSGRRWAAAPVRGQQ